MTNWTRKIIKKENGKTFVEYKGSNRHVFTKIYNGDVDEALMDSVVTSLNKKITLKGNVTPRLKPRQIAGLAFGIASLTTAGTAM